MDLETIRAASRIARYQDGEDTSPAITEQVERLSGMSHAEKSELMAEALKRAVPIAEALISLPEYDEKTEILDLSAHGLSKIGLRVYHSDGSENLEPFDGIAVDIGGVYEQHHSIGELHDDMVFLNRDGTISDDVYDGFDRHVHASLEYLETLESITIHLASQTLIA